MKIPVFLRIASVMAMLYCAGHLAGFPWIPGQGPDEMKVIEGMKSASFEAEGVVRTYWDFYIGFGLIIGSFLLFKSVVLWQIASLVKHGISNSTRGILISFIVSFVINAILSWKFFFAVPAILSIGIVVWISIALAVSYRKSQRIQTQIKGV